MINIKAKIKDAPKNPGVYHFLDATGGVLYVGKAKNIRNRLRQYFLKELGRGPAIDQMVAQAQDIRWIETESEIEAVIFEAERIKELKPKYNVRLKDDKSFLMIKITKADFPTVELVRFKNVDLSDKSAYYFGPYPAGELLKKSLRYLRKAFPFRDCSQTKYNTYRKKERPCVYGDIFVCTALCVERISKINYNKNIQYLKNFLRGRKQVVIDSLEKEMKKLSKIKHYEEAAQIRNQLQALLHIKNVAIGLRDDVFSSAPILFKRIECYDISNIGAEYVAGSMVVFTDGKPDKDEYRKFKIKSQKLSVSAKASSRDGKVQSDLERLKQVLERRFGNDWPRPDLIIIDGGPLQLKVAVQILEKLKLNTPVVSIAKGPKRDKNEFHFSNQTIAEYFGENHEIRNIAIAARDEAHRFAISYYRSLHRKGVFI